MSNHQLNSEWNVWIHDICNNNWDITSYKHIFKINNIYDYIYFISHITDNYLSKYMFFIMRDDIKPLWEDDNNKNGCTYSFKVQNKYRLHELNELLKKNIAEVIHKKPEEYNNITGISITPKRNFSIIKIWLRKQTSIESIHTYHPYIIESNCYIKNH